MSDEARKLLEWFQQNRLALVPSLAWWKVDGKSPETVPELAAAMLAHDRWHLEPENRLKFMAGPVWERWAGMWERRIPLLVEILEAGA